MRLQLLLLLLLAREQKEHVLGQLKSKFFH